MQRSYPGLGQAGKTHHFEPAVSLQLNAVRMYFLLESDSQILIPYSRKDDCLVSTLAVI